MRRRPSSDTFARVDGRTKDLLQRAQPGDIAVIDHEDLDRLTADGLVAKGVGGVVNAAASCSGRYPNLGPLVLAQAGIPLVDGVGSLLLNKVREGERVSLVADRLYVGSQLAGVGTLQTEDSVLRSMDIARESLAEQFESFARNTVDYIQRERDLLFGGSGLPKLRHDLADRQVLVVVRGTGYREDLAALRPYIQEVRPALIGVDGGADALMDFGYRPDLIIGDFDSVSQRTLELARPRSGWLHRRRRPTELVLHAYADGKAPGRDRLDDLGLPYQVVEATGTSEDVAYLLAHESRAELIVTVGSHGNLREFLDKGRQGMASTFLVRLRVGEILMDAKGVSRLYPGRVRFRETLMLVGAALFAMGAVIWVSEPLRLYVSGVLRESLNWLQGFF